MEEGLAGLLEARPRLLRRAWALPDEHDGVWMPGVLSRKKQVAAPIMAAC